MFTTRPELAGTFGMAASTHWLASQTAMAVLERGGNAFDAAVAAGFVLQVVEPHLNGPAGEVPIVAWVAREARPTVVCGQGVAPAGASLRAFEDLGLSLIPGTGLLPACVPGAFGGWMLLLQRYGTMRLADVLGYAIDYANGGFPVVGRITDTIGAVSDLFQKHWPTSAATWLDGGGPPQPGSKFTNPDLGQTYVRILAEATAASADRDAQIEAALHSFYQGFVADAIDAFVAANPVMDSTGDEHRGLLRGEDLAAWAAAEEAPVSLDYEGLRILKPGAWSQGPVFLQQLALLRGIGLADLDPVSPEFAHAVVESAKLAFADREAFYGDPAFVDVPLAELLSPGYNDGRRQLISDRADTGALRPGCPGGREPRLARIVAADAAAATAGSIGEPTVARDGRTRGDTCHVDIVDRWGNMVSATPSGGWLQSSPTIPGLGFCLGTRGQMFYLDHGLPNSLAPGKRPRTTLSPTLALREGRGALAFGTPGGDQQDQWSLLFFLRHVHHRMNLQEAIDAPAWHTTHFPSSFYPREASPGRVHIEGRAGERTIAGLRDRGHDVSVADDWSLGRISAVSNGADGLLRAGANPRGMQGYATGR
jgi:gamma-glutamyltranspeptidase / glutathione hydrolase